ncbi:MAG: acyl-CoA synthetase [Rhodoferax sp.]|nr:acyl-CoA synthetase [Pseudorhodobacter sp.]
MLNFATRETVLAIEAQGAWDTLDVAKTIYQLISRTKAAHGPKNAVSFQLTAGPTDSAETLSWNALHARVTQAANLFRSLGVGETEVVAYVLPNCMETVITLLGGAVAGIVNPINPLMEPDQIASILRETKAKVVVTLRSFPKTELAQRVAEAVRLAPNVKTVLEVDLNRYLAPPKSWIVPLVRPKNPVQHAAAVKNFNAELARQPADKLSFPDGLTDRVAAYFHTGGTTGVPKVAQHRVSGMVFNGWTGSELIFSADDVVICPLPLFHVLAAYPVLMSMIMSGAHVIYPTPAGYRGEGVFDNFWKLIERWRVTQVITVPTALAALMQRPINANISSLRGAFSGSSSLPLELYTRFEKATGVQVIEGYGLTECTCIVSCSPPNGVKKSGSVGLVAPHCDVRILHLDAAGAVTKNCTVDEVGEICVYNPGVFVGSTYTDADKNKGLYVENRYLRTGDLGRLDADGYLFITGRAKDLIIRGGHNIDPAVIEEALMHHPSVAFVGAIGQPDAHAGELPCAYVELVKGADTSVDDLMDYARGHIEERAAIPKYIELIPELPKTAVGKIFKPDLRRKAITRVYNAALADAGLPAEVQRVIEDKKRGLTAQLHKSGVVEDVAVNALLGQFTTPWEWAE